MLISDLKKIEAIEVVKALSKKEQCHFNSSIVAMKISWII